MKKIALILVDGLPVPNVKGGAIETLLTMFLNCNELQHQLDVDVYSMYDKSAARVNLYHNSNIHYIYVNKLKKFLFRIIRKMNLRKIEVQTNYYYNKVYQHCKKNIYDLIIFEGGSINGWEFKAFSKLAPLCYHLHYNGYPQKSDDTYKYLIGVSDFVVKEWKNVSPSQFSFTVKNGIELSKFNNNGVKLKRSDLGILDNDFVAIYVGRIIEVKGVYELLCAVEKLNISNFKLLIIGSANFATSTNTEFEKKIQNKIASLGEKIVFTGYVPNEKLSSYYQLADIQVIPSVWEEAAGLVAIEGMASGLPIIATKSGGMVEYINSECALIIEKDDNLILNLKNAIIELYNSPERCKKMSDAAIVQAQQFSSMKYYQDMVYTIFKIISKEEKK